MAASSHSPKAGIFGIVLGMVPVTAALAICYTIEARQGQTFEDGSCITGCDTPYYTIKNGGNCQTPVSVGGPVDSVCFTGTTFTNPDGTVGCAVDGGQTIHRASARIICLQPCQVPVPL